jgi:hypothetical protein
VFAQVPTIDAVQARLRSEALSDIAWGAFLASQYRLRDAVPLLVSRLQALPTKLDGEELLTAAALLDSLIQLRAQVPAEAVMPSCDVFPVQCVILLRSASAGRDDVLLSLFGTAGGERWFAIANALLETKPPRFGAALLRGLRLPLDIHVSRDGRGIAGDVAAALSGSDGGPWYRPDTFPPHAEYHFSRFPRSGAAVLSAGPTVSYYTRDVIVDRSVPQYSSSMGGPTDWDRVDYLAALSAGTILSSELRDVSRMLVRWRDAKDLLNRAAEGRAALIGLYERWLRTLVAKNLLTEQERQTLAPVVRVRMYDFRDNRVQPLPRVE